LSGKLRRFQIRLARVRQEHVAEKMLPRNAVHSMFLLLHCPESMDPIPA